MDGLVGVIGTIGKGSGMREKVVCYSVTRITCVTLVTQLQRNPGSCSLVSPRSGPGPVNDLTIASSINNQATTAPQVRLGQSS